MNILYFDPRASTNRDQMYSYYNGTYSELVKKANVTIIRHPIRNINDVMNDDYDAIVFGLGWFAEENLSFFKKINNLSDVKIPVICNMHKVANQTKHKLQFIKENKANLVLMSPGMVDDFSKNYKDISFKLFPFAAHPTSFYDHGIDRIYDFGFSGAMHAVDKGGGIKKGFTLEKSLLRTNMTSLVNESMSDYNFFWNCSGSKAF